MTKPYDALESRSREQREADHLASINGLLQKLSQKPEWADRLGGVAALEQLSDLQKLPVRYKSDLPEQQRNNPPFANFLLAEASDLRRMFFSPGPIADPESRQTGWWGTARALHHAGFKRGDIVQNCFSYHFTPAGAMFECGLSELGIAVIPAGTGQSELQAKAVAHFKTTGYVGTPDYLRTILECADELGLDSSSLDKALVTGGYYSPQLKEFYQKRGIRVFECFGTADLGVIAYQRETDDVLWLNENILLEVVRPGTGIPVPVGEVGEALITRVDDVAPLIRFSTGDLTAFADSAGCRQDAIVGWRGRADQAAKIKGQFVRPQHIQEICERHPEIARARLEISQTDGKDRMCLMIECSTDDAALFGAIENSIQSITNLKGSVKRVEQLPNDGLVIKDCRS